MSFKWKWLLTTFLAQLLLGGIFAGIQYWHMGNLAQAELQKNKESFRLEVVQDLQTASGYSTQALSSIVREIYLKYRPAAVWVQAENDVLFSLGEVPKGMEHVDALMLSSVELPKSSHQLQVLFDEREVYRSRDDMLFHMTSVFLLSAVACSLILLGLSNALLARLEDLRSKAMDSSAPVSCLAPAQDD